MMKESFETIRMEGDDLILLDQRRLPSSMEYIRAKTVDDVYRAIKDMAVRGAPLIGSTAGYGVYFAAKESRSKEEFLKKCTFLASARPTAVNLMWAVDRMKKTAFEYDFSLEKLLKEADRIKEEDIEANHALSSYGSSLLKKGSTVLTHCNAGALATSGWGTALGVIKQAFLDGRIKHVYADETRPRLQGARLTAFELVDFKIPSTLIPDSVAATLIRDKRIDAIIVGADRIALNGDTANKIGTYTVAIAAKYHNIPFYIAAPLSTIDTSIKNGDEIVIEERSHDEVTHINGKLICSPDVNVINPGFDVTPHELITGIITEKGILRPDYNKSIAEAFKL